MPAWGIAFRFWGGVIAAAVVVVQFSLFRYYNFLSNFIDFLDNFSFVFSVFLIFIQLFVQKYSSMLQLYVQLHTIQLYVQYFIIILCLFITFLQALVHWYAYESCFVFFKHLLAA